MIILGRPCRTEKARCNRKYPFNPLPSFESKQLPGMFFIERLDGASVTLAEAKEVVNPYGELDMCKEMPFADRQRLGFENEGVMINFVFYDEGQNAKNVSIILPCLQVMILITPGFPQP